MMTPDSGASRSVWLDSAPAVAEGSAPLAADLSVDAAIVGAGIAGLSVAYHLAQQGHSVAVLDDGPPAGGESCRTTAHLAWYIDDGISEIERIHSPDKMRFHVESHAAAIDRVEQIVRAEGIDCGFRRLNAYLFVAPAGGDGGGRAGRGHDFLARELDLCRRIGIDDADFVDAAPVPGVNTGRALRFPRHGRFHVGQYLAGLAAAVTRMGGRIFPSTRAVEFQGGTNAFVRTASGHTVRCRHLVVATNSPVNDRVAIHTKQAPYRTYVVAFEVPRGSVQDALYWDTADPYHYVRLQEHSPEADLLIVGGEDHKTGHAADPDVRFARLEAWTRRHFSSAGRVTHRWSGQVLEPADAVAFIGRNPLDEPNVYVVTGDSGMGMTHGTIAGMLIADLVAGKHNPWASLYDPGRIRLKSSVEFLKENVTVAADYLDHVRPGQVSSADEVAPGEGAILRRGLAKVALYKDPGGRVHERSAVCPHMGCVVRWNPLEKTWDCPCHGSRFDALGRALNGPTLGDLKPVEAGRAAVEAPSLPEPHPGDRERPAIAADQAAPAAPERAAQRDAPPGSRP